jgi:hypothetical protein
MKCIVSQVSHVVAVVALFAAAAALSPPARANVTSISDTGTLSSPESAFQQTFTLSSTSTIEVQTWGFGGGTNANGQLILAGGFDSLVALFSGPATNATILTDGGGNPLADAQNLFNPYSGALFGCPPAGTVTVGTVTGVCGDNTLKATLTAGTYTLLLTDANFIPLAVNPGILSPFDLTDTASSNYGSSTGNGAYTDFSSGVFQTCASASDCNTDNGKFAVDIVDQSGATLSPTPEPGTFVLYASGLTLMGLLLRKRRFLQSH